VTCGVGVLVVLGLLLGCGVGVAGAAVESGLQTGAPVELWSVTRSATLPPSWFASLVVWHPVACATEVTMTGVSRARQAARAAAWRLREAMLWSFYVSCLPEGRLDCVNTCLTVRAGSDEHTPAPPAGQSCGVPGLWVR